MKHGQTQSQERQVKRLVVKIGSSTLTNEVGAVDTEYLAQLAGQVSQIKASGTDVVIVSSAAIVAGLEVLGLGPQRPDDIPTLQAAAAVGQLELSKHYASAFEARGLRIGQVLLTRHDTESRESYLHARDTLERLLKLGVTPIINENDTVAVDEIRFGDNDTLAAHVGILLKADLVLVLSDIDGLYTADPRQDEDAKLIRSIGGFTESVVAACSGAGTHKGSGGMITKLEAARMLMAAGIPMVICQGRRSNAVVDALEGKQVGTRFSSQREGKQVSARRLWLALAQQTKGVVTVDAGAARALTSLGSSLLAAGIIAVSGSFVAGDTVDINNQEGLTIGRGISGFDAAEVEQAKGLKSPQIAANETLAHRADAAVIHRDEMVVF